MPESKCRIENFSFIALLIENILCRITYHLLDLVVFFRFKWFWLLNALLFYYYMFNSPYKIVMRNISNKDLVYENLIYGETPFSTLRKVFSTIKANSNYKFIDIGSARGLNVFLAGLYYKMESTGIELLDDYVIRAKKIAKLMNITNVRFYNIDFQKYDISEFDIIYVSCATWDSFQMKSLTEKLAEVKKGAYIVTVSVSLKLDCLKEIDSFKGCFSWGYSTIYFYQKCDIIKI